MDFFSSYESSLCGTVVDHDMLFVLGASSIRAFIVAFEQGARDSIGRRSARDSVGMVGESGALDMETVLTEKVVFCALNAVHEGLCNIATSRENNNRERDFALEGIVLIFYGLLFATPVFEGGIAHIIAESNAMQADNEQIRLLAWTIKRCTADQIFNNTLRGILDDNELYLMDRVMQRVNDALSTWDASGSSDDSDDSIYQ